MVSEAPRDATVVVFHTAALAYVDADKRAAFADALGAMGVASWSNEPPGVLGSFAINTSEELEASRLLASPRGHEASLPLGQQRQIGLQRLLQRLLGPGAVTERGADLDLRGLEPSPAGQEHLVLEAPDDQPPGHVDGYRARLDLDERLEEAQQRQERAGLAVVRGSGEQEQRAALGLPTEPGRAGPGAWCASRSGPGERPRRR